MYPALMAFTEVNGFRKRLNSLLFVTLVVEAEPYQTVQLCLSQGLERSLDFAKF